MIIDPNLERSSQWKPNTGQSIGGVAPSAYGTVLTPDAACGWRVFYATGIASKYCDWVAALQRPWMTNSGLLTFAYDLIVDVNSLTTLQALETDSKISTPDGWQFNQSVEIDYSTGILQVSSASGAWVNTPFTPGKYVPNIIHHVEIRYQFDTTKHVSSTLSVQIDDELYTIPSSLQNVPAVKKGWAPGPLAQVQQDINPTGGSTAMFMRGMEYRWE